MALITQGKANHEISRLTDLSINSIKSHIRNAYRKARRVQAHASVLWGVDHGFRVDSQIDAWCERAATGRAVV